MAIVRDLIEVRPRDGVLTDRDIRKLKRLWRQHGQRPQGFYAKPSERRRQKRQRALWRRKQEGG